jgi:hypothetical protein
MAYRRERDLALRQSRNGTVTNDPACGVALRRGCGRTFWRLRATYFEYSEDAEVLSRIVAAICRSLSAPIFLLETRPYR